MTKSNEKDVKKIRIATLIFACLVIVVCSVLMYSDELTDEEFKDVEMKKIEMNLSLGDKVKEYFNYRGLVNSNTVSEWKINEEVKVTDKVYYFTGTYKCSNKSGNCVYQEAQGYPSSDGKYPFEIYAYLDEDNDIKMISSSYKKDESEVVNSVRTYYENNNLVDYSNVIKWEISKEKLISGDGEKVYLVEGKYKCIDDTLSCISLQSGNVTYGDGTKPFKIYATFVDNGNSLNLVGISSNYRY